MPIPIPALPTVSELTAYTALSAVFGGIVSAIGVFAISYGHVTAIKNGSLRRYVWVRTAGMLATATVAAVGGGLVALLVALAVLWWPDWSRANYYEARALYHVYPDGTAPGDWTVAYRDGRTAADYLWADDTGVSG